MTARCRLNFARREPFLLTLTPTRCKSLSYLVGCTHSESGGVDGLSAGAGSLDRFGTAFVSVGIAGAVRLFGALCSEVAGLDWSSARKDVLATVQAARRAAHDRNFLI